MSYAVDLVPERRVGTSAQTEFL